MTGQRGQILARGQLFPSVNDPNTNHSGNRLRLSVWQLVISFPSEYQRNIPLFSGGGISIQRSAACKSLTPAAPTTIVGGTVDEHDV